MELANQIRRHRLDRNLSQDDLASAIFVTRQTVSNWENDKTYPDVESLLLLSRLFDVSIDELIQGDLAVMRRAAEEDAKRMRQMSTAAVTMMVLAVAFFIALATSWRDPSGLGGLTKGDIAGFFVFVPLYALSMVCALKIEKIKRRHDLVTYQEIVAFSSGKSLDDMHAGHSFTRKHPAASLALKMLAGASAGAVVGLLVFKFLS